MDVIAEFTPGRRLSLLDMVAIENRLAEMLGVRVDLSPAKGLKEPVAARASRERAPLYARLFGTMIQDWRRAWGQGDFPFFFVQLANFTREDIG